jgi:UDP-N-acetylmuramate dehydrogenase
MAASALHGFENTVCSAVPLASVTYFHIGGPAEYFVEPENLDQLVRVVDRCVAWGMPLRILGGGSNVLVDDRGIGGAVLRLSQMRNIVRQNQMIFCEAGARLMTVVRRAEEWGLSGLEPLTGIPGTVGGAIAMNAGGRHGCIGDVLHSVTTLDRFGRLRTRDAAKLEIGYRRTNLDGEIVAGATLNLTEKAPAEIAEKRQAMHRAKSETQPLGAWSAGCVFKNADDGRSAGALIDQAGLKGQREGRAVVSEKHANFIVNEGGATARDVRKLIDRIRHRVRKAFGVELELEIELWN